MNSLSPLPFEWSVAHMPQPGQSVCGDHYVVEPFSGGVLLGVVDGLGHGAKAEEAAKVAVKALKTRAQDAPTDLMQYCHQAVRQTRGAVVSLASIRDGGMMTWLGVGNVTSVLFRSHPNGNSPREYLHVRGGIVGYRLPPLRAFTASLTPGDTLIFVTDGIRSGFGESLPLEATPEALANLILEQYSRQTDDALVLVARYNPA